ncbi:MAG TPA: putative metal-binding motif-containing protein [Myxococcus sp.]|nr:putative metal-binding motif-containing protein [Myxococcus sp.]
MNRPVLLLLPLVLLACNKEEAPDATQAAVLVRASFTFKAGCIVVDAEDAEKPENRGSGSVEVFGREAADRTVSVAVFRKDTWGRTLKLTTSAREESCTGPVVATDTRQVTLEKAGKQTVDVRLEAVDADNDGYVPVAAGGSDCDDANAAVSRRSFYVDGDGDGVGAGAAVSGCTAPSARHVAQGGDCDDMRASVRPGLPEACDGLDNDCSNGIDDGLARTPYFLDGDRDGRGAGPAVTACVAPPDHVAQDGDCDDGDAQRRPGFSETCDGKDNNCDSTIDDGLPVNTYFRDADTDTYGLQTDTRQDCRAPAGYVARAGDCDDGDAQRRPALSETCDGKDNDCNGSIDNGLPVSTYYQDEDGDTYGLASNTRQDCRAPAGYVNRAGDCNDGSNAVNPGATEVCNDIDDNCAGGTDEGFTKQWYRDGDNDTYGLQSESVGGCAQPSGYVNRAGDCNDGSSAVNPGVTEVCNDVDDNCAGGTDEGFTSGPTAKGAACSVPCPGGTYICNPGGTATTCNAPQPRDYFPDVDGDGAGAESATPQNRCPSAQPANTVTNQQDCDDADKHNYRNNAEVCDARDNNCSETADEANVCGGTGWAQLSDNAVTGASRNWNTVALNQGRPDGYPVWIAGNAGVLARRTSAMTAFTSFDGRCGGHNWRAAWVRPSDGRVYLVGDGGRVAEFSGGPACPTVLTLSGASNATGIVGFESGTPPNTTVVLYVVDVTGRLHSWRPPVAPLEEDDKGLIYRDVHGFSASRVFLVGQEDGSKPRPIIETFTGGASTSPQTIQSNTQDMSFRSVWMGGGNFAYAVGDGSMVERWNGTAWSEVAAPASVDFRSVCVPDPSSVYTADVAGVIRRYTGSAWVTHHTAGGELRDIELVSPSSVWAVGPGGRVIHFPE